LNEQDQAINRVADAIFLLAEAVREADVDPYNELRDAINNVATAVQESFESGKVHNLEVKNG